MKERPMLFNGEMVRAILSGSKTQTRRPVPDWQLPKHGKESGEFMSVAQRHPRWGFGVFGETEEACMENYNNEYSSLCPFGKKGDSLWVRETFAEGLCTNSTLAYRATHKPSDLDEGWYDPIKWKPSIHMPRSLSRIDLKITRVRVERIQSITISDAIAEGVPTKNSPCAQQIGWVEKPVRAFRRLWERTYGDKSWNDNSWVWVIEFEPTVRT